MRSVNRLLLTFAVLPIVLAGLACGSSKPASTATSSAAATPKTSPAAAGSATGGSFKMDAATTTPSGLEYIDTVVGTGDSPTPSQSVVVNYTGKLASNDKVFDSTSNPGRGPATFALAQVIKGFAEGISTMKPGGKRTVYIPAALGYGANPPPGSGIPANADLIFDIELISVK